MLWDQITPACGPSLILSPWSHSILPKTQRPCRSEQILRGSKIFLFSCCGRVTNQVQKQHSTERPPVIFPITHIFPAFSSAPPHRVAHTQRSTHEHNVKHAGNLRKKGDQQGRIGEGPAANQPEHLENIMILTTFSRHQCTKRSIELTC